MRTCPWIVAGEKAGEEKPFGGIAQVVDQEDKIVPVGQTGKLRIYSENLLKEYTVQPEITGFFDSIRNGWLYTGNTAKYTEEGNLILS